LRIVCAAVRRIGPLDDHRAPAWRKRAAGLVLRTVPVPRHLVVIGVFGDGTGYLLDTAFGGALPRIDLMLGARHNQVAFGQELQNTPGAGAPPAIR
jgi:hypothetical protein